MQFGPVHHQIGKIEVEKIDSQQAEQVQMLLQHVFVRRAVIAQLGLSPVIGQMRPMRPVRILFQYLREVEIGCIVPQRSMPQPIEQPHVPIGFQISDLLVRRQLPAKCIGGTNGSPNGRIRGRDHPLSLTGSFFGSPVPQLQSDDRQQNSSESFVRNFIGTMYESRYAATSIDYFSTTKR